VDQLEAQLADAQSTAAKAKTVIDTLHNPGAQIIPAGYATSAAQTPSFAKRRAVVWNSPIAHEPFPGKISDIVTVDNSNMI